MTTEENIKAILTVCFTGFKEELIDIATYRIMELVDNATSTTEVVISDDLGHEIKGFFDKGRDMIFTGYGIAPRRWFDAKYTITEMSGGANDGQM